MYQWVLTTSTKTYDGYVVVRGPDADPIGNHTFAKGEETWFLTSSSSGGTPSLSIELLDTADPSDQELVNLVNSVVGSSSQVGTADMEPSWSNGATPITGVQMFTLTGVDGPGEYDDLYEEVSVQFEDPETTTPLWFSSDSSLYSIFGGSSESVPVAVGTTAYFEGIGSTDPGYPDSNWFWYQ